MKDRIRALRTIALFASYRLVAVVRPPRGQGVIGSDVGLDFTMHHKFIGKKVIERKTKMRVFKTIFRPVLTFSCESWVLNERQRSSV